MVKHKKFELEDISKEEIYECLQRNISEKIDYWYRIKKAIDFINAWKDNETDLKVSMLDLLQIEDILKGEVEIIDDIPKEDKKIENNNRINRLTGYVPARLYLSKKPYDENLRHALENIGYKVNEIIDRLNGEDNEDTN